jgi:ketosteroid isomerase-like protein
MAQDNVDVIQSAWDAFGRGDIDKATSVADPSAEFAAPETLPWGGTYHGPEGWADLLASVVGNFDKFAAKPEKVLGADDDHVIVVARMTGRTKKGEEVENEVVWVYKMRNGQVVRGDAFTDTASLNEALG